MAMKILLLIALAVALRYGYAQNCNKDSRDKFWSKQRPLIGCNSPKDTLVQLKVPEGFDYVKPSVIKIKQCSGLFCPQYPNKCLPVNPLTKILVVEAFKRGADHKPKCMKVYVEEHTKCVCDCVQTKCKQNQIFNDSTCECECDPKRKRYCEDKEDSEELVQWSEKSCDCLCLRPKECDDTMIWNQGLCKCDDKEESNELYDD